MIIVYAACPLVISETYMLPGKRHLVFFQNLNIYFLPCTSFLFNGICFSLGRAYYFYLWININAFFYVSNDI